MEMKTDLAKAALSVPRQRLVELMQTINFGRIEDLAVRGGNPVFDPPPRIVREVKFGGENGPRPEQAAADFLLKAQVVELFQQFEQIGDGVIESIDVKHGLPFRMTVPETVA
jgi:hypothetical protein